MREANLTTVVKTLGGAAFCKDSHLRFAHCNEQFVRMTGFSSVNKCIGKGDLDVTAFTMKENFSGVIAADRAILASGEPLVGLVELHEYTNGLRRLVMTNKYPLLNVHDEVVGIFGVCVPYQQPGFNFQLHQLSSIAGLSPFNNKQKKIEIVTEHGLRCLTGRECQCLVELLSGKTAKAIGTVLGISHRTVTSHLNALKLKLNCHYKSDLIKYVLQKTNFLHSIDDAT